MAEIKSMQDYLEWMAKWRKTFVTEGFKYSCIEEFVLTHGSAFPNRIEIYKGKKIKRKKMKECFKNAFRLAEDNPDLYYVEGYASTETLSFPFLHAWCCDRFGNVIDPTWRDGLDYFGVIFNLNFVRRTIVDRMAYGVLDNMEQGFPLLAGKFDESEFIGKGKEEPNEKK